MAIVPDHVCDNLATQDIQLLQGARVDGKFRTFEPTNFSPQILLGGKLAIFEERGVVDWSLQKTLQNFRPADGKLRIRVLVILLSNAFGVQIVKSRWGRQDQKINVDD